ncbi:MAG: hemolysin III family protein [Bacteroidetes bacterium]|nr:hemolysin III family protein [Bacteroidota bacterium]MCH8523129.1 hemolysin III family protein [Balneolales bacterium]
MQVWSALSSRIKDPVSSLTHAFAAVLSLIGLILLIRQTIHTGDDVRFLAVTVFGLSMVFLYTASAVYHWLRLDERGTLLLRKLDHSMIYVLIAGTYTPYCLLAMDGTTKWVYLITIWVLAKAGILIKLVWFHAPRWLSTGFYVFMGWLAVWSLPNMSGNITEAALYWTIAGGLFYTIGAVIYGLKKPDPWPDVFGFHEIWHLFVMAGTASHFWAVYWYM